MHLRKSKICTTEEICDESRIKNDASNRNWTFHTWHGHVHSCALGITKTLLCTSVHLLITPEEGNFMIPSSMINWVLRNQVTLLKSHSFSVIEFHLHSLQGLIYNIEETTG